MCQAETVSACVREQWENCTLRVPPSETKTETKATALLKMKCSFQIQSLGAQELVANPKSILFSFADLLFRKPPTNLQALISSHPYWLLEFGNIGILYSEIPWNRPLQFPYSILFPWRYHVTPFNLLVISCNVFFNSLALRNVMCGCPSAQVSCLDRLGCHIKNNFVFA